MNKKFWISGVLVLSLIVGGFVWLKLSIPRVAYVRTADLVNMYEGMKEAKADYKIKMDKWQSNVDTLESDYQRALSKYNTATGLSSKEKKEREEMLMRQEQSIREYVSSLEKQAQEEDQKMTQAVLNQINSYIQDYSKEKGYSVVMGLTTEGNVLYGDDAYDITEDLIVYLNTRYKGK